MKQNKSTPIIVALVIAAFFTRFLQIFFVIDSKTGFYKIKFSALGLGLTVFAAVLCAAAALLARNTFDIIDNGWAVCKAMPIVSCVLSIAIFYEVFVEKFIVQGTAWQVVLMKAVGVATAGYFVAFSLSRVLNFKIPDMLHSIPAFYMIIRIICSFINISSLSLIAENIFLLASYCCALLFFVSYAAFYCTDAQVTRPLYTRAVLAFSLCFITALPNIIANVFTAGGYTHIPIHSQVVLMAFSLFLASFIYEKFFKAEK